MSEPSSRGRARAERPSGSRAASDARAAAPAVPLRHPAAILVAIVAALGIAVSVSYRIYDPDVWQHLSVGRAIAALKTIPRVNLWSWPTWGAPEVNYSWAFEALLWPIHRAAGVTGLFVFRWITTLAAFGFLWACARRMGARGFAPLVVFVGASLIYRGRSMVRPEMLVAVLLAAALWILETRRRGGPDRTFWLVPMAVLWANLHGISWYLMHLAIGAWLLDAQLFARRRGEPGPSKLWLVAIVSVAAVLLNPFGWRAPAQPFEYFLFWRHEPIYQTIGELKPVDWSVNWKNGLPLLVAGWPILALARIARRGLDLAEAFLCGVFLLLAVTSQRFTAPLSLVAAPFVARDLSERLAGVRLPSAFARPWPRALAAAGFCVLVGLPEWTRPEIPLGISFDLSRYPVVACDVIERAGIRGRGFNAFFHGGYLLWRFWPERSRLPFMDIHQSGTTKDRLLYAGFSTDPNAWRALDDERRFDWVLLPRAANDEDHAIDFVEADSSFALVFLDDAAGLWVRREGPLAGIARDSAYRAVAAGSVRLDAVGRQASSDTAFRAVLRAELARQIAVSPGNSVRAHGMLGDLELLEGRFASGRDHYRALLALDPLTPRANLRIGESWLEEGDARAALDAFRREGAVAGPSATLDRLEGNAWSRLGDRARAQAAWRRALRRDPGNGEVRDSLGAAAIGRL